MKRILAAGAAWMLLFAGTTARDIGALIDAGKPIEAFALAQERAAAGDPEADLALAWFYETGEQITADKAKAAGHYRKCADAGLSHCQWRLGVLYDMGEGVAEDPAAAFDWISKAEAQGYEAARVSLAVLYATGRGTRVDYAKAMALYRAAAKAGQPHGFYGVGVLYALGQGVSADPQTAAAWLAVADSVGDERAGPQLQKMLDGKDGEYRRLVTAKADEIYKEYVAPLLPAAAAEAPDESARE